MGEVRKLHKKLRQIENLEIKSFLTPEERVKQEVAGLSVMNWSSTKLVKHWSALEAVSKIQISRKEELRTRLAELLLQHSAPQQTQGIVGDNQEKMKRRVGSSDSLSHTPAPKVPKGVTEEVIVQEEAEAPEDKTHNGQASTQATTDETKEEKQFRTLKETWEKSSFRITSLEGHSDIITCVIAVDNLVVSGSRDTTVKVWHVPTATEQRNLGGHSGGVTCLSAPPTEYCKRLAHFLSLAEKERFVLSGSEDCYVKIWALSTGYCVKSIYTFNPVSALTFIPEEEGYIVSGSAGGKVEVWSWDSMECCQSVKAHGDSVTTLHCQGPLLFSGSADGAVSVWKALCSAPAPLQHLCHWSSSVTGCDGQDSSTFGWLALSPRGDKVFLADGKASLKILSWRTGSVSRLANHSSIAGVTDCVSQTTGILIASCFDLATGKSSLNLFSLPQCKYLVSLSCPDIPRILCFTSWLTASGGHRWVTGGRVLTVWEQLQGNSKKRGDVTVRRDSRLEIAPVESDRETDEVEDSDDFSEEDSMSQGASETENEHGASWLRCVLQ
ncbi:hypothetical protein AGOR_G00207200 [Albula goreensis]|uniref:Uncharacterized protein n=1 Tax=Albula goreensis TaxID=1534307 RepID=A0A8T3CTC0_9TELE|nr:hypothetical protein AGOR_G00207200 [Albula goreensis]